MTTSAPRTFAFGQASRPGPTGPGVRCYAQRTPSRAALLVAVGWSLLVSGCFKRGVTPIQTHFNKGVYQYSRGDYEAAVGEFRMALEEDAGDRRARFNLAEALEARAPRLERQDQPGRAEALRQEAEEHYRAILAELPGDLRASVNLAAREHQRGDEGAAEDRLRAAIERYPRSALPRVALAAHKFRDDSPASLGEAAELLEAAVDRDPVNVDANVLLGQTYAALARVEPAAGVAWTDRARQAFGRALDQRPGDVGALLALARLERRAGEPDRAESLARRALYVRSDLLEAHLMLAELLDASGDLEEATAHLWRGRQLEDPQRPHLSAEEYQRRLRDLYRRLAEREGAGAAPD